MNLHLIDLAGALGGNLFLAACVPMMVTTIRHGKAVVTNRATIWTFVFACLFFGAYLIGKTGWNNVPSISLVGELVAWLTVAYYSYFPRRELTDPLYGHIAQPDYQHGYGICTREVQHDGPCNGIPNWTCNLPYRGNGHFSAADALHVTRETNRILFPDTQ